MSSDIEALLGSVSADRLMEVTRGISRWARLSGTADELRAVEYVKGVLEGYGMETAILRHEAYISLPGAASIDILHASGAVAVPAITHAMAAPTGPDGITGRLVHVGEGFAVDYQGRDLTGCIALTEGLASEDKVMFAQDAGAIGIVNINDAHTHEMIVSPVWGSPTRAEAALLPRIPVLSVADAEGPALRAQASEGGDLRLFAEVDTGWREVPLLEARIDGEEDDFVLFSGHIDSWHFGAMDNGTANATMVEVARILKTMGRSRRGLRLCFWSCHSHGRYAGSAWYADTHFEELSDHCVAHVNIDSVGAIGASVLSHGVAMAEMRPLARSVIAEIAGQPFHGARPGRSGDQSFVGIGIPSLFMSLSEQPLTDDPVSRAFAALVGAEGDAGGLGWWWHTTEDTMDKIDEGNLVRDCRIYLKVVHTLLSEPLLVLDYGAAAGEVESELRRLQEVAEGRFDLSRLIWRAAELKEKAALLYQRGLDGNVPDGARTTFNLEMKRIARSLNPVAYTKAGRFAHDLALGVMPRVPLLSGLEELARADGDMERMMVVELRRAHNIVADGLREALTAASRALAASGEA